MAQRYRKYAARHKMSCSVAASVQALCLPRHIGQHVAQHHPGHRVVVQVLAELEGRDQQPAAGDLPLGHQRDGVVQPAHEQAGVDIALEVGRGNAW